MSFAIGERDRPIHITPDDYISYLKWIQQKAVVLWDEGDKRGWLLNGLDALFHLLRTSLEGCRTDDFNSEFVFDFSKFNVHMENNKVSARRTLLDQGNRRLRMYVRDEIPETSYTTLQDRVMKLIGTLEMIFDHQCKIQTSKGINAKLRLRRHLEGWGFRDLALGHDLDLRVAPLNTGSLSWLEFTREIGAVTLFGKGFGELIIPAPGSNRRSCQKWGTVPKGKYYLCAGVDDILRIMGKHTGSGEENEDVAVKFMPLTTQLRWLNPSPKGHPFSDCPCSTKDSPTAPWKTNCCPVQYIISSTITTIPRFFNIRHPILPSHLESYRNGAVVFGQGVGNLIRCRWSDNRMAKRVTLAPAEVPPQPNDHSDHPVSRTPPPSESGSGSSDSAAQPDGTTPSSMVESSNPDSSQPLNGSGESQVLSLAQIELGCDAVRERIDRKEEGKTVIRPDLSDLMLGRSAEAPEEVREMVLPVSDGLSHHL